MRTTLNVDDHLLRRARKLAAAQHMPLDDVINRALRHGLEAEPQAIEATVTYGDPAAIGPDDATLRAWSQRLDDQRTSS